MKLTRILAAAGAAVALTACGGASASGGSSYDSADAVRADLAEAGLECKDWNGNDGVVGAKEDGGCGIDGTRVNITLWSSAEQRDMIREATAVLRSGYDVDGDLWTVTAPTKALAEEIADALGGTVQ